MRIAIIGTAGRQDDGARLSKTEWVRMNEVLRGILDLPEFARDRTLVSGGAAWADHLAVEMFLERGGRDRLMLYFPAPFGAAGFQEKDVNDRFDPGRTANYYHRRFSAALGVDTIAQMNAALHAGATAQTFSGFKARNLLVADSDVVIAFTFGDPDSTCVHRRMHVADKGVSAAAAGLKDGGTAHTFDASKAALKIHISLPIADPAAVVAAIGAAMAAAPAMAGEQMGLF